MLGAAAPFPSREAPPPPLAGRRGRQIQLPSPRAELEAGRRLAMPSRRGRSVCRRRGSGRGRHKGGEVG